MKIKRVLETCLCAEDLQGAEEFYTRILGLAVFAKLEGRHVFFRLENQMFLIFNPAATLQEGGELPPHGTQGPGHVAFAVGERELDSWRKFLGKQHVRIEKEITWPSGGRSLYFRDPAGNSVELATPKTWEMEE